MATTLGAAAPCTEEQRASRGFSRAGVPVGNEPCVFVEFSRGNDYYAGNHTR